MKKQILFLFAIISVNILTAQSLTEIEITFQVNMELEIAAARFNPTSDTLFTHSSVNDWSDYILLTPSVADTNIYIGSTQFDTFEDETILYKFGYSTINDTRWEVGPSYYNIITSSDINSGFIILPIRGFGNYYGFPDVNMHEVEIRFIVDMNNSVDKNGVSFTTIDNVIITGSNPPLERPSSRWPDSDSNKVLFMFDDGTNGDEVANDNFWTKKVTFPIYSPTQFFYRYGTNWGLESNGGTNNNESSNPWEGHFINTFIGFWKGDAIDVFGTMGHKDIVNSIEQIGNEIPSNYELKQNYPNPFNPSTIIDFSIPESGLVTLIVFNTLGQEVAELINDVKSAGSYEVLFEASNLSSGLYIYQIHTNNFSATKKMLLLK